MLWATGWEFCKHRVSSKIYDLDSWYTETDEKKQDKNNSEEDAEADSTKVVWRETGQKVAPAALVNSSWIETLARNYEQRDRYKEDCYKKADNMSRCNEAEACLQDAEDLKIILDWQRDLQRLELLWCIQLLDYS
jgi:hypothetical protein